MSMKTLFYLSLICVVTLFSACGSNTRNHSIFRLDTHVP